MIGLRRALVAIGLAGIAFAATAVVLVVSSGHDDEKTATLILGPVIGLSFVGTGLFAWWRRPDNRVGMLMTSTTAVAAKAMPATPMAVRARRSPIIRR